MNVDINQLAEFFTIRQMIWELGIAIVANSVATILVYRDKLTKENNE